MKMELSCITISGIQETFHIKAGVAFISEIIGFNLKDTIAPFPPMCIS
jgi:hypothetical protein